MMVHNPLRDVLVGATAVTAIFVLVKAVGWADHSWWWAFAPLWGTIGLITALAVVVYGFELVKYLVRKATGRRDPPASDKE